MAESKTLIIFILILIFCNFFVGAFGLSEDAKEFDIKNYLYISSFRDSLKDEVELNKQVQKDVNNSGLENFINSLTNGAKLTFIAILGLFSIFDFLIALMVIIGLGFSYMPTIINTLILVPIGLIITINYIIPIIRGN